MNRTSAAALLLVMGVGLAGCAGGGSSQQPTHLPDPSPTASAPDSASTQRYLVTLDGAPVASYTGDADGAGRTAPEAGQPFDPNAPAAKARSDQLTEEQQELAERLGFTIVTHYTHTLNGFAADLTEEQAAELAAADGVLSVEADRVVPLDSTTPSVVDGS